VVAKGQNATREGGADDEEQFREAGASTGLCAASTAGRRRKPDRWLWRGARCDGRSARQTGRTVQFATVVSPEFKKWLKVKAAQRGKTQAALLDDMKDAYIEKYGDE
jgi:hypothetical protein